MVEIYDPNEQGEVVKKWLSENGSAIVMGLVIAFGGLFGFKQWQSWQESNKQQASAEFEVMSELLTAGQLDAAMSNFQNLQDNYSRSPYASMAALQMARARLDGSQADLAIGLYEFVVEKRLSQGNVRYRKGASCPGTVGTGYRRRGIGSAARRK